MSQVPSFLGLVLAAMRSCSASLSSLGKSLIYSNQMGYSMRAKETEKLLRTLENGLISNEYASNKC